MKTIYITRSGFGASSPIHDQYEMLMDSLLEHPEVDERILDAAPDGTVNLELAKRALALAVLRVKLADGISVEDIHKIIDEFCGSWGWDKNMLQYVVNQTIGDRIDYN